MLNRSSRCRTGEGGIRVFRTGGLLALFLIIASSASAREQGQDFRFWGTPYYDLEPCLRGDIAQVSMGVLHSAVVFEDGSIKCWGLNHLGQCDVPDGIGPDADRGQVRAVCVSAGGGHTAAVLEDGSVRCWGENEFGECNVPPDVGTPTNPVRWVGASVVHTTALLMDGSVVCWGNMSASDCGEPLDDGIPVMAMAVGDSHSIARRADGSIRCWGEEGNGHDHRKKQEWM